MYREQKWLNDNKALYTAKFIKQFQYQRIAFDEYAALTHFLGRQPL